ncbi:MAG: T9SS type A sorting domain-containing protein [Prolixibacteraceae bacterium]|nr:T9SS type A sorting domain-containing protein [Prolixibacteraceae bacterium]
MRKSILLFIIIFLLSGYIFSQIAVAPSGTGTQEDPYQIFSLENLYWITSTDSTWQSYFVQTADIDASETSSWNEGSGWIPIGKYENRFKGTYNGNGYTISGITAIRPDDYTQGLFGWIHGATIKKLGIINATIEGYDRAGVLTGVASSSVIDSCYSVANVTGRNQIGGLIGYSTHADVSNSYSSGNISGENHIGGLIGDESASLISYCFSTATVTGVLKVGGLSSANTPNGTIIGCYATGNVSGNKTVGGLVGENMDGGFISCSYSTANVSGFLNVGGLVGDNSAMGKIENCYSIGSVTGNNSVGGMVGQCNYDSSIKNCFYSIPTSCFSKGIGYTTIPDSVNIVGSNPAEMVTKTLFSMAEWDFSGAWGIIEGKTYAALANIDNAPFAFYDTVTTSPVTFATLLANDYDYETQQQNLVLKIDSLNTGTVNLETISFNATEIKKDSVIAIYHVGEIRQEKNDTLWGNRAQLIYSPVVGSTYNVTFTVTDDINAIANASITFNDLTYTTNNNGQVTIGSISTGTYNYTIYATGYNKANGSVIVDKEDVSRTTSLTLISDIEQIISDLAFKVFPNPSNGIFNIQCQGKYNIQVFDLNGKIVMEKQIENSEQINLIQKGTYIIQSNDGQTKKSQKVVVSSIQE